MPLSNDDLRAVLTRAEAIQGSAEKVDVAETEVQSFIQAAEEAGYTRSAVERALKEHLAPMAPPAVGELAFAKSTDGKYYVGEVLSTGLDGVRIRFMRGGEHTLDMSDVRPCSLLPGQRLVCQWPSWGPWTCTVISYDVDARRVKVSDGWMETQEFPLSEVWLNPTTKFGFTDTTQARISNSLIAAIAGTGALIGSVITALLLG